METQIIYFSLIGFYNSDYEYSHPSKFINKLGSQVLRYEGVPIADCAFMEITPPLVDFPKFIEVRTDFEFTI